MPSPDIIVPLSTKENGPEAWVYIDSISIDRNGTLPLVTPAGTEDKWRVSTVAHASLAEGGEVLLDENNKEIPVSAPAGFQSRSVDIATIAHDPRVLQAVALMRDALIDLHSGVLVPRV